MGSGAKGLGAGGESGGGIRVQVSRVGGGGGAFRLRRSGCAAEGCEGFGPQFRLSRRRLGEGEGIKCFGLRLKYVTSLTK